MSLVEGGSSARRRLEAVIGFSSKDRGKRRLVRDSDYIGFARRLRRRYVSRGGGGGGERGGKKGGRTWEVAARGGHRECKCLYECVRAQPFVDV